MDVIFICFLATSHLKNVALPKDTPALAPGRLAPAGSRPERGASVGAM